VLAQTPTPLQRWMAPGLPPDIELWIKRDDMTGITASGNKVRKLEFLLAEALQQQADCVITCGGLQSNHARATAVLSRELGLDSYLVLNAANPERDPGLQGNLLLDRLVGAEIRPITFKQYLERDRILAELVEELRSAGRRPYLIPEGGSNALGSWGYLEAIREIESQARATNTGFSDLVFACGSAGTAAGLAVGACRSRCVQRVHAVNVCWNRDYFAKRIRSLVKEMGQKDAVEDWVDIVDGYVGDGYARSRPEELERLCRTARATGIILDPVYTGKAFHGLCGELAANPARFAGRRILFIHTGGAVALFA